MPPPLRSIWPPDAAPASAQDAFHRLSEARASLAESLGGALAEAIKHAAVRRGLESRDVGVPSLWHFIVHDRVHDCFAAPPFTRADVGDREDETQAARWLALYKTAHARTFLPSQPHRVYFMSTESAAILVSCTEEDTLYLLLSPLVTRAGADSAERAARLWIGAHRENMLIDKDAVTFGE